MKFFLKKRKLHFPRYDNSVHFGIFFIFLLPSVKKFFCFENLLYFNIGWSPLLIWVKVRINKDLTGVLALFKRSILFSNPRVLSRTPNCVIHSIENYPFSWTHYKLLRVSTNVELSPLAQHGFKRFHFF